MLLQLTRVLKRTPFHPQWLLGNVKKTGQWVAVHAKGRMLDVGCADRWVEEHLPNNISYVSLDSYHTGKDLYEARPQVFGDASALPFQERTFDTILMLEVLEHLYRPERALKEARRLMVPGGSLILTVPFLYPIHDAPFDYQRYTAHGLTRELSLAGLQVEKIETTLGSSESAGLICCLAVAGMCLKAFHKISFSVVLIPVAVSLLPIINLTAWLGGKLLPSWDALSAGYRVIAKKP